MSCDVALIEGVWARVSRPLRDQQRGEMTQDPERCWNALDRPKSAAARRLAGGRSDAQAFRWLATEKAMAGWPSS